MPKHRLTRENVYKKEVCSFSCFQFRRSIGEGKAFYIIEQLINPVRIGGYW